jgi:mannose-1-phosphate guanylyltransferase
MPTVEAVILAGGLGSRLLPLTERHPKHLLPVANLPFLTHQLARLADAGADHVVLATSYHAGAFEPVFGDGSRLGLRLTYVTEPEALGTGGALRNAADRLDARAGEPVVVLNGDQLSDHDLAGQVAGMRAAGAVVSLHLVEVADPRAYGCVPTDTDGRVTAFLEKSAAPVTHQINAGCYVFDRSVVAAVPAGRVVSLERETFPGLLAAGSRVVGFLSGGYWADVGTPAALVQASADLVRGRVRSPALPGPGGSALVDAAATVRPTAHLGGGSAVGPSALVGAGAVVDGSVLMAGAAVAAGARVTGSVLGPGARVGTRTTLDGVAVGDDATIGVDCRLGPGTRVPCGATVPDRGR